MPTTTSVVDQPTRRVAYSLLVLSGVLVVGWCIAIVVSWHHIVSSHARLGYLVGDLGVAVPLCVGAAVGLLRRRAWDVTVLQLAVGALGYDAVHFTIYLIQEQFLGLPAAVYLALLAIVLYVLGRISVWAYRRAAASEPM